MQRFHKRSPRREQGAALIIVLAFVVLVTGLVVAYFSRTTADRQVAHGSFNQSKADQLAASAADIIIGDLRQEIVDGSTPTTINGFTTYSPNPAANMNPQRSGNPAGVPNLIRRSVRSDPIASPGRGSSASAVNSTTDVSANGRSVTSTRWNSHYLVPKKDTGTDDSVPIDAFAAATPDWVYLTNQGATIISAPSSSVIGRYAYAIYDEGGLLDMNVAGYPSGTTAAQSGRKGPVAFADLSALPYPILNPSGSTYQVDRIVGWRNYGATEPTNNFPDSLPAGQAFAKNLTNSAPATAYYNSIINNTSGFLSTSGAVAANGRTDQMFLSRQELIAFRKTLNTNNGDAIPNTSQFDVNALQYLGTFFRELNAPSWTPTQDASAMGGSNGAGNVYAYQTNANSSTAINRNFLNVRVANSFTRPDSTEAASGEPLIKRRFPLSRLIGLGPNGPLTTVNSTIVNGVLVPASTTTVQRDFGLLWNSANSRWDYVGPTGSTVQTAIETLNQVANENPGREPNFFELLKAVILSGSVGLGSGSANSFVTAETKYYSTPLSADYQLMQIGANIIDQWDSDNVPTFINFASNELAGTENLPYLNKLVFKPFWKTTGPPPNTFDAWLLPSLWNPHQIPAPATQNVRIVMTAGTMTGVIKSSAATRTSSLVTGNTTPTIFMTVDASKFGTSAPSAPTSTHLVGTPPSSVTPSPDNYYGFHFTFGAPGTITPANSSMAYPDFVTASTFQLQVQVGTTWKAYQTWTGCGPGHPIVCQSPPSWTSNALQDPEFVTLDPRTVRFGVWGNDGKDSGLAADYTSGVLTTLDQSVGSPPSTGVFETIPASITALRPNGSMFASPTSTDLYKYANNADGTVYYTGLDAVQRRGDVLTSGMTTAMQPANSSDRPLILNGKFQSVADLGQVFRDQPWKTLNFTARDSADALRSADAGLLDVFTLHESSMEAGKSSLNTRQAPVLTAILSQATKRLTGTNVISSIERDNIVTALTNLTTAQPMLNKAELVTRLAADLSVTGLGNKEARECVVRAFSDACQTRTWNLMIDVIAQSGRYPPGATDPAKFVVEGEQRYWVHVAIDRFTGEVIDRQVEVVKE
jgi:hypothetical protein